LRGRWTYVTDDILPAGLLSDLNALICASNHL
jgi:hypothetical protein